MMYSVTDVSGLNRISRVVLGNAAHDDEVRRALRELDAGPLLTVPLVIRDQLIGAVTFV